MNSDIRTITFDADTRALSVKRFHGTDTPSDEVELIDWVELVEAMGSSESHSIEGDPQRLMYAICDGALLGAIFESLGEGWTEDRLQEIVEEIAAALREAGYKAA